MHFQSFWHVHTLCNPNRDSRGAIWYFEFIHLPLLVPTQGNMTCHIMLFTGSIQKHDALCVLALNVLNEKIYIFLWFWFIFLSVLSGLALLYSTVIVVLPSIRETILKRRFRFGTPTGVSAVVDKTQVSIWTDITLSHSEWCELHFPCIRNWQLYFIQCVLKLSSASMRQQTQ